MEERFIYTLVRRTDWEAARAAGHDAGSEDDRRDGFLHFSTAAQLRATAARRRRGLFPHLYGVLPLSAVVRVLPLPVGPDGLHVFPEGWP
ncbi:MAG: DUF952 domain-containing protein [Rhodovarius sp.]|nr:DUF952 domain-containing protein [Rhodovarius sp.]